MIIGHGKVIELINEECKEKSKRCDITCFCSILIQLRIALPSIVIGLSFVWVSLSDGRHRHTSAMIGSHC